MGYVTLPKGYGKHGNWDIFTLGHYLGLAQYPIQPQFNKKPDPIYAYLKPINLSGGEAVDIDQISDDTPILGVGRFNGELFNSSSNLIPKGSLGNATPASFDFINQVFDKMSDHIRAAKKATAGSQHTIPIGEDEVPEWVAVTLLTAGYIMTVEHGPSYFGMKTADAVELLSMAGFEEAALIAAARKPNVLEWVKALNAIKNETPELYSLDNIRTVLQSNVEAKDAAGFMGIPNVWLEELLAD